MTSFHIETQSEAFLPITRQVSGAVEASGVQEGICVVYSPHTTAGITINENADPDVVSDLQMALSDIFHNRRDFRHREGNSTAHLRTAVVGSSVSIPIADGRLALGRWQGIFFCEFDGPASRRFLVQILGK